MVIADVFSFWIWIYVSINIIIIIIIFKIRIVFSYTSSVMQLTRLKALNASGVRQPLVSDYLSSTFSTIKVQLSTELQYSISNSYNELTTRISLAAIA